MAKKNIDFNSLYSIVSDNKDAEAFKLIKEAADEGNPEALYHLGICYYGGHCVTQDKEKAIKHYLKASKLGCADAQFELAHCYLNGDGVERNISEFMKWMRTAEKNGCRLAQHFSETYPSEESFIDKVFCSYSIKEESEN